MKFACATFLLVVLFVSVMDATDSCTPSKGKLTQDAIYTVYVSFKNYRV